MTVSVPTTRSAATPIEVAIILWEPIAARSAHQLSHHQLRIFYRTAPLSLRSSSRVYSGKRF